MRALVQVAQPAAHAQVEHPPHVGACAGVERTGGFCQFGHGADIAALRQRLAHEVGHGRDACHRRRKGIGGPQLGHSRCRIEADVAGEPEPGVHQRRTGLGDQGPQRGGPRADTIHLDGRDVPRVDLLFGQHTDSLDDARAFFGVGQCLLHRHQFEIGQHRSQNLLGRGVPDLFTLGFDGERRSPFGRRRGRGAAAFAQRKRESRADLGGKPRRDPHAAERGIEGLVLEILLARSHLDRRLQADPVAQGAVERRVERKLPLQFVDGHQAEAFPRKFGPGGDRFGDLRLVHRLFAGYLAEALHHRAGRLLPPEVDVLHLVVHVEVQRRFGQRIRTGRHRAEVRLCRQA